MFNAKFLTPLVKIHRWLALALSPFLFLVIVSGAVLAFKPIVENGAAQRTTLDVPALVAAIDKVDPNGRSTSLKVAADGRSFELRSPDAAASGSFVIGNGAPSGKAGFDLFDFALRLHKNLLVGAGVLVEIATYVMVVLIVSGLLLGWPKLRNTLAGWHAGLGWLALPLVVITPVTGLMLALHLGTPSLPAYEAAKAPLPIARTLEIASRNADLTHLTQARNFRRGAVMLSVDSGMLIVSGTGQVVSNTQGAGWVRSVHQGTWAGAWSGLVNLLSALTLLGLLVTGVLAWWRRRRSARQRGVSLADPASSTLVAFASQTGTAAKLAEATAQALRSAGESVMLASLGALQPEELAGFRRTLLIASTTGDGELPDPARGFMQKLASTPVRGSRFSLLALGDKRYSSFCGGAIKLRAALIEQGAEEIVPLQTVDGDVGAPWQDWLATIGQQLGLAMPLAPPAPALDRALRLQLVDRVRLDDANDPALRPTWQLRWRVLDPDVAFRPGDLLLITPAPGIAARCYSIGSSSPAGADTIELTVSLHSRVDDAGRTVFGLASSYLCQHLKLGAQISAQLRRHPDFNPPDDIGRPLILIASGCGIAPFPGFLAERRKVPGAGPVWLLFGNRKRHGDYLYADYFAECLADGTLEGIDTAFSRDADDGAYIQQRLGERADKVVQWMTERDALIYVCGKASTLGAGVDTALIGILSAQSPTNGESAPATLARWKAEGRLKQDLFV